MRNALGDRGPVVSLKRRDGSKPLRRRPPGPDAVCTARTPVGLQWELLSSHLLQAVPGDRPGELRRARAVTRRREHHGKALPTWSIRRMRHGYMTRYQRLGCHTIQTYDNAGDLFSRRAPGMGARGHAHGCERGTTRRTCVAECDARQTCSALRWRGWKRGREKVRSVVIPVGFRPEPVCFRTGSRPGPDRSRSFPIGFFSRDGARSVTDRCPSQRLCASVRVRLRTAWNVPPRAIVRFGARRRRRDLSCRDGPGPVCRRA